MAAILEDLEDLEDLETLELLNNLEKCSRSRRIIVNRTKNDYETLNDIEFISLYRLSKRSVSYLVGLIGKEIEHSTDRNYALAPMEQVLLTLGFYGSGVYQKNIANIGECSQSTCSRTIGRVSRAIVNLKKQFIYLPNSPEEFREVSGEFNAISSFPDVYGAVSCTHIPILSPGGTDAEKYKNNLGASSLNIQTVTDATFRIRNIIAEMPGSMAERIVFENSEIPSAFESGQIPPQYHLVGGVSYNCRPGLMTPISEVESENERRYNSCHRSALKIVAHQHYLWKKRFPRLFSGLRTNLDNSQTIIVACAILHNLALQIDKDFHILETLTSDERSDDISPVIQFYEEDTVEGIRKRNSIIQRFFSH